MPHARVSPASPIELLAPAGDRESLVAAVRNGADAVYLGLQEFNARRGAANFTTEGLAEACIERADRLWSLSPLTFPHPLVRVIVAEQIYRAWTILKGHPYHRG
jgi:hypothetical protein